MSTAVSVLIHPSQFPEQVRRDLHDSLRCRQVNPKFHYDSVRQTQKWLALHQAFSPSRRDLDCAATYDRSFTALSRAFSAPAAHLIGLGCGGGQKDTRLLRLLRESGRTVSYTPVDVSSAMVLEARQSALAVVPPERCFPLVCDLATAGDIADVLAAAPVPGARLITFFGMIPNFEPGAILSRLAQLVRPGDQLLFSANLAPGEDYARGVEKILPLYDNALTRDWLMTFLLDLGFEAGDGALKFGVEEDPLGSGLKRVVARFEFVRQRCLLLEAERFEFEAGENIRLFFSYRHTPGLVCTLLAAHGLEVRRQWLAASGEEGVFWVARAQAG